MTGHSPPAILEPAETSDSNKQQFVAHSRLEVRFTSDGTDTCMLAVIQEPPWRAVRAFRNAQRQAVVHLHNVSGGILAGDLLSLSIEAEAAARVQVTSVGATRIYRQGSGDTIARLVTSIRVADDAMLEYLPDVTIPFAGSRFSQKTNVSLAKNAGFIGWDMLAAGRIASGEEFEFDLYASEFSVYSNGRPIAIERYSLAPAIRDPTSVARWGRFRYLATLYVCHSGVTQSIWDRLESQLNEIACADTSEAARWGVSTLISGGIIIRGLTMEAHQALDGLHKFWGLAKQEIWGESAMAPRKIN